MDHITNNSLRYLQPGKGENEGVKDYINSSRKLLQMSLTREERKRDLSSVSDQYEKEKAKLEKAREIFEEDLQRFQSMRADIDALNIVGSEQLTAKLEKMRQLDKQIMTLQIKQDSLAQQITDETVAVHHHFDSKKLVAWLKHSIYGEDVSRSAADDSETSELDEDTVQSLDGNSNRPMNIKVGAASFITEPSIKEDKKRTPSQQKDQKSSGKPALKAGA